MQFGVWQFVPHARASIIRTRRGSWSTTTFLTLSSSVCGISLHSWRFNSRIQNVGCGIFGRTYIFREDIMNFARVFTGFDEQGARGNIEHVEGKVAPACSQSFSRVVACTRTFLQFLHACAGMLARLHPSIQVCKSVCMSVVACLRVCLSVCLILCYNSLFSIKSQYKISYTVATFTMLYRIMLYSVLRYDVMFVLSFDMLCCIVLCGNAIIDYFCFCHMIMLYDSTVILHYSNTM